MGSEQCHLKSVNEEFEALSKLSPENRLAFHTGQNAEIAQQFRWVNEIAYIDSNIGHISYLFSYAWKPNPISLNACASGCSESSDFRTWK